MIDTIRLGYHFALSSQQLESFTEVRVTIPHLDTNGWQRERKQWVRHTRSFELVKDSTVTATYYPCSRKGDPDPFFLIEFSLPKLVFGNNIRMVQDMEEAAAIANKRLELLKGYGIPSLDVCQGSVIRIDLCYNHQVGDLLPDYLAILTGLNYPHRKREPYKGTGVLFKSKSHSTTFYDKYIDSQLAPKAYGILRQEQRLLEFGLIKDVTNNNNNPTLLDFNAAVIQACLQKDIKALHLAEEKVCRYQSAFSKLDQKYSPSQSDRLYGFLVRSQEKTREQLMAIYGSTKRKLDRDFASINEANVSCVLSDNIEYLPPLSIDFEKVGD